MTLVKKGGDQKIEKTGFAHSLRAAIKAKNDTKNLEQTDKTSLEILPDAIIDVTKVEDFEELPPKYIVQAKIKVKTDVEISLTRR